jgi:hypothetical protein
MDERMIKTNHADEGCFKRLGGILGHTHALHKIRRKTVTALEIISVLVLSTIIHFDYSYIIFSQGMFDWKPFKL